MIYHDESLGGNALKEKVERKKKISLEIFLKH